MRGSYIADIKPVYVYKSAKRIGKYFLIALVAGFLILVAFQIVLLEDQEQNQKVATFNAYSQRDRELILKFATIETDENQLMKIKDLESDQNMIDGELKILKALIVFALIVLPCLVFLGYWKEKSNEYHLADLPFSRPYGWVLLLSMTGIPWLILFVARIDMHCQIKKFGQAIKKVQQKTNTAKKRKAKPIQAEKIYEICRQNAQTFDAIYQPIFVSQATHRYDNVYWYKTKEAEHNVSAAKRELTAAGERLQKAQRSLNDAEAQLRQVKLESKTITKAQVSASTALTEWETIQAMRGVIKMSIPCKYTDDINAPFLVILVTVCVPYGKKIYDFGDYEIKLFPSHFTCRRVRSGLLATYNSRNYPNYNQGSAGFCFGRRRDEIENHLRYGRIIEATTLIIDCLHSVNDEDDARKIPTVFNVITDISEITNRLPQVEKKKRRR